MDKIVWNRSFEVGYLDTDEQHRRLLDSINWLEEDIVAGESQANLINVVKDIYFCFQNHFSDEESLMRVHHYAYSKERRLYHQKFLAELSSYIESIKSDHSEESVYECYDYIYQWFFTHLLEEDGRLYRSLQEQLRSAA